MANSTKVRSILEDRFGRFHNNPDELNLYLAYIGNVERWGDQRSWYVGSRRGAVTRMYKTEDLDKLAEELKGINVCFARMEWPDGDTGITEYLTKRQVSELNRDIERFHGHRRWKILEENVQDKTK